MANRSPSLFSANWPSLVVTMPPIAGVLSAQHFQKHGILERNRHLADLEIDLLTAIVLSES